MLNLVIGVKRHLGLQIGHQKEPCECLFCFVFSFFFFVKLFICVFVLFFPLKKMNSKFLVSILEMMLQLKNGKMLSCAHWL